MSTNANAILPARSNANAVRFLDIAEAIVAEEAARKTGRPAFEDLASIVDQARAWATDRRLALSIRRDLSTLERRAGNLLLNGI